MTTLVASRRMREARLKNLHHLSKTVEGRINGKLANVVLHRSYPLDNDFVCVYVSISKDSARIFTEF